MHWDAASVSVVRLVVVSIVLGAGSAAGVDPALLPFGALAVGDLSSLLLASVRSGGRGRREIQYRARDLAGSGTWLLVGAMVAPAAGFVVSFLVTRLADSIQLGLAEAARIAAQPIFVLAVGLSAVLRPEAMEAAIRLDRPRARQLTRQFGSVVAVVTTVYLLLTLVPASLNPVYFLVPEAFTLDGLVQLSIVAAAVNGLVFLQRSELTALNRTRSLASAESWAAGARSAVALGSGWLNAWTVPLGLLMAGLIRMMLFTRLLDGDARDDRRLPTS
jgi:O-antigen/teichoic acid export membrane protein